jgi:hypothetical protein
MCTIDLLKRHGRHRGIAAALLLMFTVCLHGQGIAGSFHVDRDVAENEAESYEDSIHAGDDSTLVSEDGSSTADLVRMGESITVEEHETIEGDVVAVGGSVTVRGKVLGDVVAVGGNVRLESHAAVKGNVVCVGGTLEREDGAEIGGQNVSVGFLPPGFTKYFPKGSHLDELHQAGIGVKIAGDFLRTLGFFLIGLILVLSIQDRAVKVRATLRPQFWLGLVVGFGTVIGLSVAIILLLITCVGILIAVPAFFATAIIITGAGAVAFSLLGEAILRRPSTTSGSWVLSFAVGLGSLFLLQLVGRLLTGGDGGTELMGKTLLYITKSCWAILLLSGFGALILSRMGTKVPVTQRPVWADPSAMPSA